MPVTHINSLNVAKWLKENIVLIKELYSSNKILVITIFTICHLVSSTLCLPGSCTFLNTLSGAMFGFWSGCGIVYFATMLGASIGYLLGKKIPKRVVEKNLGNKLSRVSRLFSKNSFILLTALRLSPIMPFGVVNIALGYLGVNLKMYLSTTALGIFFDVFLLNSIGAAISNVSAENSLNRFEVISLFIILVLVIYCVNVFKNSLGLVKKESQDK
jgi:uncharacterized membrane protein YdjX (TVP38/TMEM64 family)